MASTAAPTVSAELRSLLRRLKLGRSLDTLPERLTLARQNTLSHAEFLRASSSPTRSTAETEPRPGCGPGPPTSTRPWSSTEDSGGFRTPIPIDSVHRFRSFRTPLGRGRVALR